MNFRTILMILAPFSVLLSQAHPGHDLLEHGAGHAASSPYHLAVLTGCACVLFAVGQLVRSASARKYLRLSGAVVLAIVGALWGFGI
ncbi:MAG TPA: hypothetical protein VF773_19615 [Verrucomicrobiae bacterium]